MIEYSLKFEDSALLLERINQFPSDAEEAINKALHGEGVKEMIQSIVSFTPVSKLSKEHAKYSDPYKFNTKNLGFIIETKPKYGYLIFPDEGRGIRNKVRQEFTKRGAETSQGRVMEIVIEALGEGLKL